MSDDKAAIISLQKAFINFSLRAEKYSNEMLVDTFVDSAPLLDLPSNGNSQVVYGRRGTGKTHALKYVAELVAKRGEIPIYIDLRSVGSNTSIYNDFSRPLSERSTQLVNDVLQAILSALYPVAVAALDTVPHPQEVTIRLDDFQNAISSVKIIGTVESETTTSAEASDKSSRSLSAEVSKSPSAKLSAILESSLKTGDSSRSKNSGTESLHMISATCRLRWPD
jgi:Cdc6-like AAA superfamily ATPase